MPLFADNVRTLYASLVVAAIAIAALVLGRDILVPLVVAAILSFIMAPVANWLAARGVSRPFAVSGLIGALVAAVIALSAVFSMQLVQLTGELATYKYNLVHKTRMIAAMAKGDGAFKKATDALDMIEKDIAKELGTDAVSENGAEPETLNAAGKRPAPVVLAVENKPKIDQWQVMSFAVHPLAQAALAMLFALFMLLQSQDLRDRIVRIAGTDNLSGTTAALNDAASRLSQLFLAQAMLNVGFGVAAGFALWLIGVPNAILWGGLTILMRFVPYIGSLIAAVPPVLLAAAVDPGWSMAFAAFAVFAIGEPLMGHVVEPLVLGKKAGLSPFAMVASAAFWALIWGPVGLILAAPITMSLVVLGRYVKGLEFLTVMLGDDPALNAEQEFYHRLLSGDVLAAAAQIEDAEEGLSLPAIADGIVLPALRLAATDFDAGRIDKERAGEIRASMKAMIEEIDSFETVADDERAGHVAIIPARSQIDIAAAEFLARAIESWTPSKATALTHAAGLTAISQAAHATERFDAVIIATAGGIDTQYLPLISRKAAKSFPSIPIHVLDLSDPHHVRPRVQSANTSARDDGRIATHRGIESLLPSLAVLTATPPPAAGGRTTAPLKHRGPDGNDVHAEGTLLPTGMPV